VGITLEHRCKAVPGIPSFSHAVTREVNVVHTWHLIRSVKKYRTRRQGTNSSPVMSRCPYPDVLMSNLKCEALGTMFRPLPASTWRWTREGQEG
jgi:hypothetical protein